MGMFAFRAAAAVLAVTVVVQTIYGWVRWAREPDKGCAPGGDWTVND